MGDHPCSRVGGNPHGQDDGFAEAFRWRQGHRSGNIIKRHVSRTLAQQLATAVEKATAPFQYALTTRAGCECIGHILQVETDSSPERTVLSVDGIGAFDLVSRESMLRGLFSVEGGEAILPFVRQFYGAPSTYLWQDDSRDIHEIHQGEGRTGRRSNASIVLPWATQCVGGCPTGFGRERTVVRVPRRHLRHLQSRQNCPDLQHTSSRVMDALTHPNPFGENPSLEPWKSRAPRMAKVGRRCPSV